MIGFVCTLYEPESVLVAALMTTGLTFGLTCYACLTKKDFTTCYGVMFTFLIAFMLFGIFFAILGSNSFLRLIYCTIGICIYGVYLVIDTQLIAGGRKRSLTYDDYIIGALHLYIDIVGLFLYMLRFLGKKR